MNGNEKKNGRHEKHREKVSYVGKIDSNDDGRRQKSSCAFQKLPDAQGFNMEWKECEQKVYAVLINVRYATSAFCTTSLYSGK